MSIGRTIHSMVRSPILAAIVISGLIATGILVLREVGKLQAAELAAYDWVVRLRHRTPAPDANITLIAINERDIQRLGRWPLTDEALARILENLSTSGAAAIGVDLYRDIPVPPGEHELARVLTANRQIVVVSKMGSAAEPSIAPPEVLKGSDQVGFNDMLLDPGGTVRRALLFMDDGQQMGFSFALRLALLFLAEKHITPQPDPDNPEHLRLGMTTFRPLEGNDGGYVRMDARGYQILPDYRGARWPLRSFSLTDLLDGRVPREAVAGKVVMLGVTAESLPDVFYTPFSAGRHVDRRTYGAELHLYFVSQLLRAALNGDRPTETASESQEVLWVLVWTSLGGVLGFWVRNPWRFSALLGVGLVGIGGTAYWAMTGSLWIPLVPPAIGWVGAATVVTAYMSYREREQRDQLMQLFERHVSPEVAETIWQQRELFSDGGRPIPQKMVATVLFVDLKGYTVVSEKMEPAALMGWLNTYMDRMTDIIIRHGGVVDDYAGDSIKANFGVPVASKTEADIARDAANAVTCALAMGEALQELHGRWQQEGLPLVGMRVGIYTGPVVAGSLGSSKRLKYTTVGDTVNVAARLESLDKASFDAGMEGSSRILIGEATARCLDSRFELVKVGEVQLKGKEERVTVHRVVGKTGGGAGGAIQEVR